MRWGLPSAAGSVRVRRPIAVLLANGALLVAWWFALRAWLLERHGVTDPDLLGTTALAWPGLVIVATAAALLGRWVAAARPVGWLLVALALAAVAVETVGALRDRDVAPAGLLVGVIMVAQVVALAWSLALAGRREP